MIVRGLLSALFLVFAFNFNQGALAANYSTGFPGADENPLSESGKWDAGTGWSGLLNVQVVGNRVRGATAANSDSGARLNSISPGADQYGQIDIVTWQGTTRIEAGVLLRMAAAPTKTYYICNAYSVNSSGSYTEIYKYVSGAFTSLATDNVTQWVAGNKLRCEIKGSSIILYRDDSSFLTASDSSIASGNVGLKIAMSAGGTLADGEIDNFEGGDISATKFFSRRISQ